MRAKSGLPPSRVLVEPERRNTAMAVAWAAQRIEAEDRNAVLVVLSADQHIPDRSAFAKAIRRAVATAVGGGVITILAVRPTRPDTGYGYTRLGKAVGSDFPGLHIVKRFVEKPDIQRARRYLASGDYFWNAGIFVGSAATLLGEIKECESALHRALAPLRKFPKGNNAKAVRAAYRRAPTLPIDIAVLERSERLWALPVDFAWSDVGTWSSLAEALRGRRNLPRSGSDKQKNVIVGGEVIVQDAEANLVWGSERLVALNGCRKSGSNRY